MDAFEQVVATLLQREGFWVQTSYKVKLTQEEKQKVGRPTAPRWELDVLAYRPGDNLLRVVECKSYLDSRGIVRKAFEGERSRLKLFNESATWTVVRERLIAQLVAKKAIRPDPIVQLCLAAGNIVKSDDAWLKIKFLQNDWVLLDRDWVIKGLQEVAADGYENSIASVVAKFLKGSLDKADSS